MMKSTKRTLSVLFLSMAITFAAVQAHAVSIKDNMKQIKNLYKEIAASVNDPSKNAKSAADAAEIAKHFADVQTQVPDTISDLPVEEQADAIADFKSMIQQEIDFATALEKAFDAGDNKLAADLLQKMDAVKKEGHKKYSD
jgi:L-lactate utilization protein LutB